MPDSSVLGGSPLLGNEGAVGASELAESGEAASVANVQFTSTGRATSTVVVTFPARIVFSSTGRATSSVRVNVARFVAFTSTGKGKSSVAVTVHADVAFSSTGKGSSNVTVNIGAGDPDADTIIGHLRPNIVAPGGWGGEALFSALYFTLEWDTDVELTITPIVDGEIITAEQVTVARTWDGDDKQRESFEIGWSRDHESNHRYGLRGTYFTVDITAEDTGNTGGNVSLEGLEAEIEPLRELLPARSYTPEELTRNDLVPVSFFFFGHQSTGEILEFGEGADDDGTDLQAQATPNWLAPNGTKGEALFTCLYLVVTRDNATDFDMEVVPILDGEELATETITFEGVTGQVTEVRELPLGRAWDSGNHEYGLRGTWFTFRWQTSGTLPDDTIVLEGAELEYEPLRELKEAVNAT